MILSRLQAPAVRLACYSALILFFELALIRYTAGYVRVFGFYLNFVLIATFLGMGVGLLRATQASRLRWMTVPAAVLLFGAVAYYSRVRIVVPNDPDEFVWAIFAEGVGIQRVPLELVVVTLFALCALFFVPLGALLGAEFRKLPALRAYSFDIAGSLFGIIAFALLSALRQPPFVWIALAMALWLLVSFDDRRFAVALAATATAVLLLVGMTRTAAEYWSPYYRINVYPEGPAYRVDVNGSFHQYVLDLDSTRAAGFYYARTARTGYLLPYSFAKRLDTALVVGSGTGNDVSMLLERGARHVDAVEIDPVIADVGRAIHFQEPYSSPRVHLHIDDARAFLKKAERKYDVVVFGTLDSQTLLSGMSSVRLDNYVYTVEAFESARARLKDDGTLLVYHRSQDYIAAKIYQMIEAAFEAPPGVISEDYQLFNRVFVAGEGAARAPRPSPDVMAKLQQPYARSVDDWPYLYMRVRTIPGHYRIALVSVLLISALFMAFGGGAAMIRGVDGSMFFMGAGFLLVETKSVTEMSLLFGSTWTVNVLVFASILVMVLAANLRVLRTPPKRTEPLFAGLFGALAVAYAVPASQLLWLGVVGQWIVGGLLVALPVFFASLIFSTLLQQRADAARALAYNLLGAVVGGVLEYLAMAWGIKSLYLVAAALYAAALLLTRRTLPISEQAAVTRA